MSDLFLVLLRCYFTVLSVVAVGWIVVFIADGVNRDRRKTMSNKLKPCPFCGGEAHYLEDSTIFKLKEDGTAEKSNRLMYFVLCTKCTALVSGNTNAEAIEAWNRRIIRDVQ